MKRCNECDKLYTVCDITQSVIHYRCSCGIHVVHMNASTSSITNIEELRINYNGMVDKFE